MHERRFRDENLIKEQKMNWNNKSGTGLPIVFFSFLRFWYTPGSISSIHFDRISRKKREEKTSARIKITNPSCDMRKFIISVHNFPHNGMGRGARPGIFLSWLSVVIEGESEKKCASELLKVINRPRLLSHLTSLLGRIVRFAKFRSKGSCACALRIAM